jgi:hypothetical protein
MARSTVPVDHPCMRYSAHPPCVIQTATGNLVIDFERPDPATGRSPFAPPPPLDSPSSPPPASSSTSPAGPLSPNRAAPLNRAAPSSGTPARTAPRPPSADEVGRALQLRDADSCTGNDLFFPQGAAAGSPLAQRLGPDQAQRLFQAAALAMAIPNPTVKQNVMNAIQARVDSDTFFDVMSSVIGNIQQARTIVAAYQNAARHVAERVVVNNLSQTLRIAPTVETVAPNVDRWIVNRLATAPQIAEAVDRVLTGAQPLTAECTLNQLAMDGAIDVMNGR